MSNSNLPNLHKLTGFNVSEVCIFCTMWNKITLCMYKINKKNKKSFLSIIEGLARVSVNLSVFIYR